MNEKALTAWIADLIRNEFDKAPDLGLAGYPAFDQGWDDGAERIAEVILARFTPLYFAIRNSDDAHWTPAMRAAMTLVAEQQTESK